MMKILRKVEDKSKGNVIQYFKLQRVRIQRISEHDQPGYSPLAFKV